MNEPTKHHSVNKSRPAPLAGLAASSHPVETSTFPKCDQETGAMLLPTGLWNFVAVSKESPLTAFRASWYLTQSTH